MFLGIIDGEIFGFSLGFGLSTLTRETDPRGLEFFGVFENCEELLITFNWLKSLKVVFDVVVNEAL